jgi:FdhE protein
MSSAYDRRLERAHDLTDGNPAAFDLLVFYLEIARLQKRIFEQTDSSDLKTLLPWFPELLYLAAKHTPSLGEFGKENFTKESARLDLLTERWEGDPDQIDARADFFAHVLLEPFAMRLAQRTQMDPNWTDPNCPFCGSRAGVAVLRPEGDGGRRSLVCSLCCTEWIFRRLLCPNCGEENKEKLPVYVAAPLEHVRVEACDTCKTYIKSIDLTKYGLADPIVDEIATVPLNIWAEEHGYLKLAANVMGM